MLLQCYRAVTRDPNRNKARQGYHRERSRSTSPTSAFVRSALRSVAIPAGMTWLYCGLYRTHGFDLSL
jgi:hypothetical protein